MKMVGSMLVEVNHDDGYHGIVEIAIIEDENGEVMPGGVRDAITKVEPKRLPALNMVREAMDLAKWSYFNKPVFEGRVSLEPVMPAWDITEDFAVNDVLRDVDEDDVDPELN